MIRGRIAVLGAVAVLVSGCATIAAGRTETSTTLPLPPTVPSYVSEPPRPTGTIDLSAVNTNNPDDVARAVVTTLNQYDTRTDTNPVAAAARAAPLLTPGLAADLATSDVRTDRTWLDLEQHDGYTLATTDLANEYGQPANTDTTALAQISVVVYLIGRDGWAATEQAQVARVQLDRASPVDPWLVSGFTS